MDNIGPQRATPKSLAALKAEFHRRADMMEEEFQKQWSMKYSENTDFSNIEKAKETILSGPEKEQAPDWIKETELYKSFEKAGCYIHHSESGGFIVVDPSIVQQCKDF